MNHISKHNKTLVVNGKQTKKSDYKEMLKPAPK